VRVLLGPRAGLIPGSRDVAAALAGDTDDVIPLSRSGVSNLARRQSPAEIHAVRLALEGCRDAGIVGYVCRGRTLEASHLAFEGGRKPVALSALPVADHVNLTWASPLTGPNDASLGARFPTVAGIYRPKLVHSLLKGGRLPCGYLLAEAGVVLQVSDPDRPTAFVLGVARRLGFSWISDELVPVVLLAAHRGLAVAALVLEDPAPSSVN
jgi:hypothetical protein